MADPYYAGQDARQAGRPFNERNSPAWKTGWKERHQWLRDEASDDWRDHDAWMIDPEMEAKG